MDGELPLSALPEELLKTPQTNSTIKPSDKTFEIARSGAQKKRLPFVKTPNDAEVNSPISAPMVSPVPNQETLATSLPASNLNTTSSVTKASGQIESTPQDSLGELPKKLAPLATSVNPDSHSTEVELSACDESLTFDQSYSGIEKSNQSSLAMGHSFLASKVRPFCSAERLGGVSRLNSLSISASSGPTRSSALHHTGKKSRANSTLNNSRSGTGLSTERSQSALALKEQILAEKQRIYRERLKENAERLRAFQEAKQREREAQKRANEERRLAVKNKAQQMAEMQRTIAENKQRLEKARAQAEAAKQKTAPMPKSAQPQPAVPRLTPNATQSSMRLQVVKLPSSTVLKPIQDSHPHAATMHTSQNAPKVIGTNVEPVRQQPIAHTTQNTLVHKSHGQTVVQATLTSTVHPEPVVPNLDTSAINEPFDMSQLKSDSDSDEDQPARKIPGWSRKDNRNLLETLRLIHSGQLKWPSEFASATQMTFDLDEVFNGYKFQHKPRTSSGIWNTPSGQCSREH
ncbi:unnamed protein product [Echinostoma caproni]|uniref:INCENP_ARK-bind domain-containing protein n=1 Tax=Echinostoma caproni TaxID=27848 RepID=A0A3P8L0W6_9TREM|nr:unnamed protein product [Echinostoma caproni]